MTRCVGERKGGLSAEKRQAAVVCGKADECFAAWIAKLLARQFAIALLGHRADVLT